MAKPTRRQFTAEYRLRIVENVIDRFRYASIRKAG